MQPARIRKLLNLTAGVIVGSLSLSAFAQTPPDKKIEAASVSFATEDGGTIYADLYGKGKRGVVLVHGGRFNKESWAKQAPVLAKAGFRVLAIDLRGYGKSEPAQGEFSHLSDLVSLLDALEIHDPLVVMGCSMGGGLAMDFALTHPSRVKALIMVGSGPSGLELDVPAPAKFGGGRESL